MFKNTILFVAILGLVFALPSVASAEIVESTFFAPISYVNIFLVRANLGHHR